MSWTGESAGSLDGAWSALAEVCELLLAATPEAVLACEQLLEGVARSLRETKASAPSGELNALTREIAVVAALVTQANGCFEDRVRKLKTATAGYGARGEIQETPAASGAVVFRG